jgi:hypothetical protein
MNFLNVSNGTGTYLKCSTKTNENNSRRYLVPKAGQVKD